MMFAPIHAITRTVMIIKQTAHGAALALVNLSLTIFVAASDFVHLDNGTLAKFGASTLLLHKATKAVRRIGLGVVLRQARMLTTSMILWELTTSRTVYKLALGGLDVFIAGDTAFITMIVSAIWCTGRIPRGHKPYKSP